MESKQTQCPSCAETIEVSCINSQCFVSYKTDLSCVGACRATPIIVNCQYCKYIFFDEEIGLDKKYLNTYIKSSKYLELYKKYKDSKPFIIIYNIYKNQEKAVEEINSTLLFNYYDTKKINDLKLLIDNYLTFVKLYRGQEKDEAYLFANMLIGEYYRRTSQFDKAMDIFSKIKNMDVNFENKFIGMCDFQIKLISEVNIDLITYYNLEPDYSFKIPILDDNNLENIKVDDDEAIFWDFIFTLHQAHRYSEFKIGLEKLKEIGVDLNNASIISSILELFTRVDGIAAKNEILEMIRISIFEYDVLEIEYDEDGTLISWLKSDFWWSWKIVLDDDIADTIREYYFKYIIQNFNNDKITSLSSTDKHTLLLLQLPYYDKVKHLLELGFEFNENYDYGQCYSNIFDYIEDIAVNPNYGDFLKKEPIGLYELLSLLIDKTVNAGSAKQEIEKHIKQFENHMPIKDINDLLKKVEYKKDM